jgi:hypothetical protein
LLCVNFEEDNFENEGVFVMEETKASRPDIFRPEIRDGLRLLYVSSSFRFGEIQNQRDKPQSRCVLAIFI